jgi:hypothetical protein
MQLVLKGHRVWNEGARPGRGHPRLGIRAIRWVFGCPLGCDTYGYTGGQCAIVRTAVRSLTLRCRECGLQFTMTWHQLARAYRQRLAQGGRAGKPDRTAEVFDYYAKLAGESRGRRRVPAEGGPAR